MFYQILSLLCVVLGIIKVLLELYSKAKDSPEEKPKRKSCTTVVFNKGNVPIFALDWDSSQVALRRFLDIFKNAGCSITEKYEEVNPKNKRGHPSQKTSFVVTITIH